MFSKKTNIISNRFKKIDKLKRFSSYIGKKVYSKSGEYIGKVEDILFKEDKFSGILIQGKNLFIGREFFGKESKKVIMLRVEPVTSLIGKHIFDSAGKRIGIVRDLKRKSNSNNYTDLWVKKSIYRKSFTVPKKDINIAKKNIILKKEY